jgi:hypothetical protein
MAHQTQHTGADQQATRSLLGTGVILGIGLVGALDETAGGHQGVSLQYHAKRWQGLMKNPAIWFIALQPGPSSCYYTKQIPIKTLR